MKRYLLFLLMCVCASVGAWAEGDSGYFTNNGTASATSEGASSWEYDGASTLTITLASSSHLSELSAWNYSNTSTPWASHNSDIKKIIFNTSSADVTFPNDCFYVFNIAETFDFSSLNASQISSLYNSQSNFSHGNITNVLKNVIVPEGSAAAPNGYNTLMLSDGIVSGYFTKGLSEIDWNVLNGTYTTLKWKDNVTSAITVSSTALTNLPSSITTLDFTEVSVGATVTVSSPITTVYVANEASKNNISGVTATIPFTGVVTAPGSSLQTNIESYLAGFTGKTKDDITTLNVTGTLSSDDITYLSTMTGLTTLNLSAATGDVTNLASNTVTTLTLPSTATALPNNIATNLPYLASSIYVYSYDSQNGLTSLDAFVASAGGLSSMVADLKSNIGTTNSLAWSCNSGTIKVSGLLNSSDVTVLNEEFLNCHTLDLSGATGIKISDLTTTGGHYVVKLPAGSEIPSTLADNIWNKGGGSANMIIYSLSSDGQTISIWSNNVGTIAEAIKGNNAIAGYTGVQYALIKGKTGNDFTNDINALASYNIGLAKDPIVTNGCEVTINRAFSSATMTELLADARTALGETTICTIVVTGQLSDTDLAALGGTDATGATRIDMSGATLASGASVNDIQVPASLVSLVLPKGCQVTSGLETTLTSLTYFEYVYSETTDNGATVPNYVWIAKTGVMSHVFANESSLVSSVYVKVAAKTGVTLDASSVDLSETGMSNLAFLDVSESGLTTDAAASYKCPVVNTYTGYRIILPNGWSGDDMAVFAANQNVGSIAAVYSYDGTALNIMEIVDNSYSPAALADARIMRSGTTTVNVVSGFHEGAMFSNFGPNLLAALNNMGKSSFTYNGDSYNNNVGTSVTTINIETGTAAPNAMTFENPVITTLNIKNTTQADAVLDVDACSALTTLNLTSSTLKSLSGNGTSSDRHNLANVVLSGTSFSQAVDLSYNRIASMATSGTTGLVTTNETTLAGGINLTGSNLTSFSTEARVGGDISLNASSSLTSVDVSGATFTNTTSKIHVDSEATEGDSNTIISGLQTADAIVVPSGFDATTRVHPYNASYVKVVEATAAVVTFAASNMVFHDKNANSDGDNYRYWYEGTTTNDVVTLGTTSDRRLTNVLAETPTELGGSTAVSAGSYTIAKVVGPLTSADMSSLKNINATVLDLSKATSGETGKTIDELLKTTFALSGSVHSNTKFIILPDNCTRENIVNETDLSGLSSQVYCVGAVETTDEGRNLTTCSFVSGAVQPFVVAALNHSCQSWMKTPNGQTARNIYTSDVSNFKELKISGLINAYDLSMGGQKLDANGHLSRTDIDSSTGMPNTNYEEVGKSLAASTITGDYTVYGPFSASYLLSEIDLKGAHFEPINPDDEETEYRRYYFNDMTLSALNIISMGTYKVVIPQDSRVREIPADFMNCTTSIRAICIPSNIRAIRTRAFYTIDYVWTTPNATVSLDPEGTNTKLDNGAKVKKKGGTEYKPISALIIDSETGKYIENPDFTDDYYVGSYETKDGGGTYTFGSNIKLIETAAFANTQPHVTDVYVLNTVAPECHVDAFNTVMYTGNGGYLPVEGQKIITRENYFNNGYWITMLHYPRQTTTPNIQRYTDPTRSYSIATGMRDGKGAPLYFPNQSEFIRAYQQGTYGYIWNAWDPTRTYGSVNNGKLTNTTSGWTADNQTTANGLFNAYPTGTDHKYTSFYKVSDFTGETVTAPTAEKVHYYQINWDESNYSEVTTGGNLYPQSEVDQNLDADNSGEKTEKDYRGWHQFVLMAYAANTILEEEPHRSYITDNDWWTYCPSFDLTKKQVIELFGSENTDNLPYVSRLLYVRREYSDNTIWLNFSNNLMVYKENRTASQPTENVVVPQHGQLDTYGIVGVTANTVDDDDVVMSAGVPYLIKPFRVADATTGKFFTQFRVFKTEDEAKKNTEKGVKKIVDADLYQKMQDANALTGDQQITQVQTGLYTVPVFVKGTAQEGTAKEAVDDTEYTVGGVKGYNKSTDWTYTFVGSHYLSPLPQYCYYLGKTAATGVTFIYNNYTPYSSDVFRWVNETCIICPTQSTSPEFTVTEASGLNAALWEINATGQSHIKTGNTPLSDDSFAVTSSSGNTGSRTNLYNMQFESGPVTVSTETVGITDAANGNLPTNGKVYSLDGQQKSSSLNGLAKGIYIVNGKKYVVK